MEVNKQDSACIVCSYKCFKTHSNVKDFAFYRIMTEDTMAMLELPEECMNHFPMHGDINVFLRGPSRRLWTALVHFGENHLYLTDGWTSFIRDNSLEGGDIAFFRCAGELHFLVQTFFQDGTEKSCIPFACNPINQRSNDLTKREKANNDPESVKSPKVHSSDLKNEKNVTFETSPPGDTTDEEPHNANTAASLMSNKTTKADCSIPRSLLKAGQRLVKPKVEYDAPLRFQHSAEATGSFLCHPIVIDDDEEEMDCRSSLSGAHPSVNEVPYRVHCEVNQRKAPFPETEALSIPRGAMFGTRKFCAQLKNSAVTPPHKLTIPKRFCELWLPNKRAKLHLFYKGRRWTVLFNGYRMYPDLTTGFRDFVEDNKLRIGDTCLFSMPFKECMSFTVDIFPKS